MSEPPWNDLQVRKAIAYVADLSSYVKAFLTGNGTPASCVVPPQQWAAVRTNDGFVHPDFPGGPPTSSRPGLRSTLMTRARSRRPAMHVIAPAEPEARPGPPMCAYFL